MKKGKKKERLKIEDKVQKLYEVLKFRGKPALINLSALELYPEKQLKQEYALCRHSE